MSQLLELSLFPLLPHCRWPRFGLLAVAREFHTLQVHTLALVKQSFVYTQSIVVWSEVSYVLTSSEAVLLPVSHHHVRTVGTFSCRR